jgi:lipopolysaccharide export LptBFGC system permease protein LptF
LTTAAPRRKEIEKPDTELDAVPLPDSIPQLNTTISDLDLLGATPEQLRDLGQGKIPTEPPPAKFYLGERVEAARVSTLFSLAEQALRIIREIHFRLVFSAGPLVMLILASALAIIFRGGQLLTAFVISFVPGLLVSVLNITGRQLCVQSKYHLIGLAVMWSGIALLAVADFIVLSRFLKR